MSRSKPKKYSIIFPNFVCDHVDRNGRPDTRANTTGDVGSGRGYRLHDFGSGSDVNMRDAHGRSPGHSPPTGRGAVTPAVGRQGGSNGASGGGEIKDNNDNSIYDDAENDNSDGSTDSDEYY